MTDDPDLDGARRIANERRRLDVSAGRDQGRRDGQERVAGANRVNDGLGEGGNARDAGLRGERDNNRTSRA